MAIFIVTALIATTFFYVTFVPMLTIALKNVRARVILFLIGTIFTVALIFIFHLGFNFGERTSVLGIPFIMTFYFITGTFLIAFKRFREDANRRHLVYRGTLVLGVLVIIALSFTLNNTQAAYLASLNVFFVSFAIEFWGFKENRQPSTDTENLHRIEDYGLSETQLQVAYLFLEGLDVVEVAEKLGKSKDSVYWHSKNIWRKTNTIDRTAFVMKFRKSHNNRNLD